MYLEIEWMTKDDFLIGRASVPGDRELRLAADLLDLDLTEEEGKHMIRVAMEREIANALSC